MQTYIEYAEMTAVERAAHLTMRLVLGEEFTARQIAEEYHVTRQTAYRTLERTCRVIPLHSDGGVWRLLDVCRPG